MKLLHTLILPLFLLSTTVFAQEGSTPQELCDMARMEYRNKHAIDASLYVAMAKSVAEQAGTVPPAWCHTNYREVRIAGLYVSMKTFEDNYGDDWNHSWNQINWIESSAKELGLTLPPLYYAKAVVVKARNAEIRNRIIALWEAHGFRSPLTRDEEE